LENSNIVCPNRSNTPRLGGDHQSKKRELTLIDEEETVNE